MAIRDSMLPEFDREMKSTRTLLALVTDDLAAWQPHDKSMTAGELATHLANLPKWTTITIEETSFDVNPKDGSRPPSPSWESSAANLETFDRNVAAARAAIESATDPDLTVPWSLMNGGETVFTLPRVAVLRAFVMNHTIHHRGQLSVYLRMLDVPLPEIYGPTADSSA
jgi:uncharacterized damage-inducible protein DinB